MSMTRYAWTLFIATAVWLVSFGGFTLLVDPYDVLPLVSIDGFNARKTRAHEDGHRVKVGHRLLTTTAGTIVLGSSRVVDGFPMSPADWAKNIRNVDGYRASADDWPGGLENMGMSGVSSFEMARASLLASRNRNIHCVAIGVDLREFGAYRTAHATFWVTPLSGGGRLDAFVRMGLAPTPFARAVETVRDNRSGGGATRWREAYAPEQLPTNFHADLPKAYRVNTDFHYVPNRVTTLFRGIDALLANGVQVRLFIQPIHAWQEEATRRAGAGDDEITMRRDLVAQVSARAAYTEATTQDACFEGPALQLWDFSGYSDVARSAPPGDDNTPANPYYYIPSHFRPMLGASILDRMRGVEQEPPFNAEAFGRVLSEETIDDVLAASEARRLDWLATDPWAAHVTAEIDRFEAEGMSRREIRLYLNRDDALRLERDVRRAIRRGEARAEH